MKKLLLGAALACLGSTVASATDLPSRAPVYKAAPVGFSWSGFYAGAHGGYGWSHYSIFDAVSIAPAQSNEVKPNGWFGGGQIGYNQQLDPHWLIGTEFDLSAGDISDNTTFPGGFARAKTDYFGTARTRFGYVFDRTLIYGTGGLAWTHDTAAYNAIALSLLRDDQYHVGWTIGGGVEYALDSHWSLKAEYLYADLGKNRVVSTTTPPSQRYTDLALNTVRVGVNYRFGDGGVPAASMPVKAAAARRSNWTGSYIGGHGGYGWSDMRVVEGYISPAQTANTDPKGWFGGFQTGYNWQFAPTWLVGLETDNSFGDLKGSGASSPSGFAVHSKIDDLGTVRVRYGYVADQLLFYGTGGLAYGREKTTIEFAPASPSTKADHVGWTAGGGVEWKFSEDWSAKVEYLYADLGKFEDARPFGAQGRSGDITANTVKFGINYYGPVIERFFGGK